MQSMVIWMLGIGISIAAMVVTAALKWHYIHMLVAALVSILVALSAFQETRADAEGRADMGHLASTNLRYIGLVWTWGALAIFVTYAFKILEWREWLHFFIGLLVLAGLSLFLSATLRKDSDAKDSDPTMLICRQGLCDLRFRGHADHDGGIVDRRQTLAVPDTCGRACGLPGLGRQQHLLLRRAGARRHQLERDFGAPPREILSGCRPQVAIGPDQE